MSSKSLKVALVGNPNVGKTSLFNQLTGMNQKVGNFPGITVDKKIGVFNVDDTIIEIVDLPGTYSLYPKSMDEQVVPNILLDPANIDYPDVVIVVADVTNLKRNLLLFSEVQDLNIPVVLVLNMIDEVEKRGIALDIDKLSKDLNCPIGLVSARNGKGIKELKNRLTDSIVNSPNSIYPLLEGKFNFIPKVKEICDELNDYSALQIFHQYSDLTFLSEFQKQELKSLQKEIEFDSNLIQVEETLTRYEKLNEIVLNSLTKAPLSKTGEEFSNKLDKVFTHRVFGLPIFILIFFFVFQGIFSWAEYPMTFIEGVFGSFQELVGNNLPAGWFNSLITEGIIAGLGGIIIFIPQIAILFAFIAILEETGYMARVTFMLDRINRVFGLNGKSVVPLVSSVACAVPAIMSARNIDNYKDRLITIFVAPFMSCSARIPVYVLLIAISVPDKYVFGIFNLQGLVMFGLYFLGLLAALLTALGMKFLIKAKQKSFFIMELPNYRMPRWKNIGQTIFSKVNTFIIGAGKIIMIISVVLWFLQNYGQGEKFNTRKTEVQMAFDKGYLSSDERDLMLSSSKLEDSYAGKFGKFIEPSIKPLGFNWKIGIALITSFAAREVFTGTMATLYATNEDDGQSLKTRMSKEIDPITKKPYFTLAVALSLLVFYVLAMQCMSTVAVMRRETKGWKWPMVQMFYMTGLAYVSSFIVYNLFK